MARFVFLGRLEDVAGVPEMAMPLAHTTSLAAMMERLPPELFAELTGPKVRLAINGELVGTGRTAELMISDADEVAFLPPVSGG